jgi:pimeloyl-ACP methyl ester carboxylesterase
MNPKLFWEKYPAKNIQFSPTSGLRWVGYGALRSLGYHWELLRFGEMKLGLWRNTVRRPSLSYSKRLVLIPGFGDSPFSWTTVLWALQKVLKKQFDEIILVDFPGFGGFLANEKVIPSFDIMKETVGDVLDRLRPHTLLAHSLGGWLASHYALDCSLELRPKLSRKAYQGPSRLVLLSPSGVDSGSQLEQHLDEVFRGALHHGFSQIRPHLFANEPFWLPHIEHHLDSFFRRSDVMQFVMSVKPKHSIQYDLGKIESDVFLLWGEKDTMIPVYSLNEWRRLFQIAEKDCHVAVLPGTGHSPQIESPALLSRSIGQIFRPDA